MPWIEKTVKLQFMEQDSQQAVQRLEACKDVKVAAVALTLMPEVKTTIMQDGCTVFGPPDSDDQSARVITAEKGCMLGRRP